MWPFRTKQGKPFEQKSASFLLNSGVLQMMQHKYETFAAEGFGLNPVVHACIEKIAEAVTSVDLKVFKADKQGDLIEIPKHPLLDLLNKPNPVMTGEEFIGNLVRYYLIAGNLYVLAPKLDATSIKPAPPKELYLLKPSCMRVLEGISFLPQGYEYTAKDGSKVTYPMNQLTGLSAVLHKKKFNPIDQWNGLAPMVSAALGIDVYNEGSRWNLSLLQNGARPSGAMVLSGKNGEPIRMDAEQYRRAKEQIDQQISGSKNAARPLLLEGGLDWKEMAVTAKDMDHERNMLSHSRAICAVFGVAPMLIGIPGEATFANYEEAKLALWVDTILPLLRGILSSLTNWLEPCYGDGLILWYNEEMIPALEPLRKMKGDRVQQASYLTTDEKREAMGYDAYKSTDEPGGTILVPSTSVPLDLAGSVQLPEPGSATDPNAAQP
jgi:HK97 family phage portal protein